MAGGNVRIRSQPLNITTGATTVVKNGGGVLSAININKPIAAATIAIYDGLTAGGVLLGTVTLTADLKPFRLDFNAAFTVGLTIVTSTTTDLTVTFQ